MPQHHLLFAIFVALLTLCIRPVLHSDPPLLSWSRVVFPFLQHFWGAFWLVIAKTSTATRSPGASADGPSGHGRPKPPVDCSTARAHRLCAGRKKGRARVSFPPSHIAHDPRAVLHRFEGGRTPLWRSRAGAMGVGSQPTRSPTILGPCYFSPGAPHTPTPCWRRRTKPTWGLLCCLAASFRRVHMHQMTPNRPRRWVCSSKEAPREALTFVS